MSSAVYVLISIPTIERENQLKCDVPTLPASGRESKSLDPPLKKLVESALQELGITDVVWSLNERGTGYHVCFPCDLEASDAVIEFLSGKKIGITKETSLGQYPICYVTQTNFSSCCRIIPFSFFLKDEENLTQEIISDQLPE